MTLTVDGHIAGVLDPSPPGPALDSKGPSPRLDTPGGTWPGRDAFFGPVDEPARPAHRRLHPRQGAGPGARSGGSDPVRICSPAPSSAALEQRADTLIDALDPRVATTVSRRGAHGLRPYEWARVATRIAGWPGREHWLPACRKVIGSHHAEAQRRLERISYSAVASWQLRSITSIFACGNAGDGSGIAH